MGEIEREGVLSREKVEEEEEAEASVEIWKYIFGFVEMAVVKCAIELGIAEAIEKHGRAMTVSEISSALGCDPALLKRIMRFLAHRKIFKAVTMGGSNGYTQTPLSRRLMKEGQQSMAALLLLESTPIMLAPWHSLSARVMANGRPSFQNTHGEDVWRYAAANLDHSNLINEAMACDAKLVMPVIIENCNEEFRGLKSVVDVGGGNGTAMRILHQALPSIRAINFDLPHVIAQAPHSDGLEHGAGDMFQSVPKADAAFLMWVLHDWSDEECIEILKKCREAISKENGKVMIVEAVIEEGEEGKVKALEDVGLMLDMVMMAHTNFGKERTLKEWEYVIKMAGFSSYTVKPIPAVQSVILAFY
ncbi:(RS)-norcoclaurine 6-O-methyltransferase [Vigna angularis]|uniref:(RS)-norcoclaurine 6-O-methyltransferase n=2 Tax=Phaseolus angularis TaxID=3914 RepID=A0A8T0L2F1_PHAAN|nr:acetylserotonin O-methyltransferase-like [Vigna angularis]KAG2406950.1 (RS)-norcoclaurine 6-O-methyltransferase [Vigna angularis]BAT86691.1 hypothetical protein VIGAN_04436700 [Vigna angularis var. angularis]